jgi:hypothetical protein
VLAAEHAAQLGGLELALGAVDLLGRLLERLRVLRLGREIEQHGRVLEARLERVEEADLALDAALLAQQRLGRAAILPEIRPRGLGLERLEALAERGKVKDASGARRSGRAACAADP